MKKILALALFFVCTLAQALDLPAGYIGRVLNNTANTWQHFTLTYTPTVSGSQYVMFAFRQDPAYWYFDNVSVKATGSSTNLITNGTMTTGGSLQVQTSNYGTMYINAPTAWGVSYQSGVYPSAAGTWSNGQWVDGAVGSYDGIYQGLNMTAGTTYIIEFDAMGNHTATTSTTGWQLAVYAGSCANTSLNPTECTLSNNSGFQTVAQPSTTYTTGCTTDCPAPPPPTPTYCCGGTSTAFTATQTQITNLNAFVNRTGANTRVYVDQIGNNNTIVVNQSGTPNNYAKYTGNGSNNTVSVNQTSTSASAINYTDLVVTGNQNTVAITQQSTGGTKSAFVTVQDNNNTVTLQQKDGGSHYAEVALSGGTKNVDILQQGSANHMAKVGLTGLPTDLSLTQSGSTQQYYSINFNCATAGGCARITVTQGQ